MKGYVDVVQVPRSQGLLGCWGRATRIVFSHIVLGFIGCIDCLLDRILYIHIVCQLE